MKRYTKSLYEQQLEAIEQRRKRDEILTVWIAATAAALILFIGVAVSIAG